MTKAWGWGRYPVVDTDLLLPRCAQDVVDALADGPLIPRGLGRSYGDSSLADRTLEMTALDRFIAFDSDTGLLTVEAGVSLSEILSVLVPRGWFLPVTPGTRFVTVGGAIASDVHGKNHHKHGSFSDHVVSFRLLLGTGEVLELSPSTHPDLFQATCGGMGLTGVILQATVAMRRIQSSNIDETVIKATSLDAALSIFAEHENATYSVAWIDLLASGQALGRSLVMLGEHACDGVLETTTPASATVPFDMPSALLNKASVAAFNKFYYGCVRGEVVERRVPFESFFYPLDHVSQWNRLYGKAGMLQYQLAIPFGDSPDVLREIVERIAQAGLASPLAVLKVFGDGNQNFMSFPMPGYTLALDFRATARAFALADELDRLVIGAGGRLYLTKDSRMSAETLRAGYPRIDEFEEARRKYSAIGAFASAQSIRLGLE
ncbi:MAG TPA: FAD-binding oxidoreductase [Marmoricola sp.]|nr:FAD-binding oxidoreductase [Marmoricola sp.]